MGKTRRCPGGVRLAWGLFLCLVCVSVALADDLTLSENSSIDGSANDLMPGGLTGWFFTSDNPPPYPVETDAGQPWTSPDNIATLDYWLSLVAELQYDPSLLQELYGLGMISAPDAAAVASAQTFVSQAAQADQPTGLEDEGGAPEPGTLGLLAGSLVLLGLSAAIGKWRIGRGLFWPPERRGLFWKDGSL